MNKREMVISAIEGGMPGKVPVAPFLGGYVFQNSGHPWRELLENSSLFVAAEINCFRDLDCDAVWGPSLDEVSPAVGAGFSLRDDGPPSVNKPAIEMKSDLECVIRTGRNLENSKWVDYKVEVCRKLRQEVGTDVPIVIHGNNAFRLAGNLVGLQTLYLLMVEDPRFVHELLETCLELAIRANRLLIEGKPDIFWIAQPTASANCISRQHYTEFVHPYSVRLFQEIKKGGAYSILHTCGRWEDRFDLAIEEGADIVHVDGADLSSLRAREKRKIPIMGQVPTNTLLNGTIEEVWSMARRDIHDAGKKGGFILSASCSLPPGTPRRNLKALIGAARQYDPVTDG